MGEGCDLRFKFSLGNRIQAEGRLKRCFGVEVHSLGEITDSEIRARRSDSPRIGLFDASEDAHEGCFATAVGADEADALAVADAEGDVLQDGLDAVCFVDVMCSKHRNLWWVGEGAAHSIRQLKQKPRASLGWWDETSQVYEVILSFVVSVRAGVMNGDSADETCEV